MKYKFQVKVFMTYYDDEIEVEIDLSDEEVKTIKALVADYMKHQKPAVPEEYVPETSLLQILEQGTDELFDKLWWHTGHVQRRHRPRTLQLLLLQDS